MKDDIQHALGRVAARTVDLVSAEELGQKLSSAAAAGRPLRVKYGADPSAPGPPPRATWSG